jgi:SAM-dependent methyltransferase
MIDTSIARGGSAARQAELWGRRARDWSELAEGLMEAFFLEVLDRLAVGNGVAVLDIGCGSGVAAALAAGRGARVSGFDATPELLSIARQRVPGGEFRQGEMEQLPYPDAAFDVVTGFNSFQYAANPANAVAEARRVTRPRGAVMMATWGRPEHVAMAPVFRAVGSLLPPPAPGTPGPFALSQDGALAALARHAGLQPEHEYRFIDHWRLPDLGTALRTLLSAGPMCAAIEHAGEDRVRDAVATALGPYRTADGDYRLDNEFLYLVARA